MGKVAEYFYTSIYRVVLCVSLDIFSFITRVHFYEVSTIRPQYNKKRGDLEYDLYYVNGVGNLIKWI